MLLLHELHTVSGRDEDAFEDAFREGWMPTLAKTDDARLLYYLKLAHEFHTLLLDRIPIMSYARRNEAKRFIALIDTLYDNAVKLVASAEAEPAAIYQASEGFEAQEFRRTVSRVAEMGARTYLALPHGRRAAVASGSREGIVET